MTRVDERFARAEQERARVVARLAAGGITYEQAQQALDGLVVEHGGRLRTMGANSGTWYVYDGRGWVRATPPAAAVGHVSPAPPPTIHPQYPRQPQIPTRRGGFGKAALAATVVVSVILIAAGYWVFRVVRDVNGATDYTGYPSETETAASPTSTPLIDELGFTDYRFARCEPGDLPAVIAVTTTTALVICGYATEVAYYRAESLSGGGRVELSDAVPSSDGYDVIDPSDGTRHEVRPGELTIVQPDGQVLSEPMLYYDAPPE